MLIASPGSQPDCVHEASAGKVEGSWQTEQQACVLVVEKVCLIPDPTMEQRMHNKFLKNRNHKNSA
jgi:hypothetical protein